MVASRPDRPGMRAFSAQSPSVKNVRTARAASSARESTAGCPPDRNRCPEAWGIRAAMAVYSAS